MLIRAATNADWAAIWPFLHSIVAAGETFCYDRDLSPEQARGLWLLEPPGRTVVAVDAGQILGTAKMHRNHGGPAAHVATASFMVDPQHAGRGVGRALGQHVLSWACAGGYRAMQFNAVVETNTHAVALWRSLGFQVLTTVPQAFHHPTHGDVGLQIMHRHL